MCWEAFDTLDAALKHTVTCPRRPGEGETVVYLHDFVEDEDSDPRPAPKTYP
jgi:hypothetical protein